MTIETTMPASRMIDLTLAQARRFYLHLQSGGKLSPDDIGRLIEKLEKIQSALVTERSAIVGQVRRRADECPKYEDWGAYLHEVADAVERGDA